MRWKDLEHSSTSKGTFLVIYHVLIECCCRFRLFSVKFKTKHVEKVIHSFGKGF